jgi:hypothetical protein
VLPELPSDARVLIGPPWSLEDRSDFFVTVYRPMTTWADEQKVRLVLVTGLEVQVPGFGTVTQDELPEVRLLLAQGDATESLRYAARTLSRHSGSMTAPPAHHHQPVHRPLPRHPATSAPDRRRERRRPLAGRRRPQRPGGTGEDAAIVRTALSQLSALHREALVKREIQEKTCRVPTGGPGDVACSVALVGSRGCSTAPKPPPTR